MCSPSMRRTGWPGKSPMAGTWRRPTILGHGAGETEPSRTVLSPPSGLSARLDVTFPHWKDYMKDDAEAIRNDYMGKIAVSVQLVFSVEMVL